MWNCRVNDLKPLAGMPLQNFNCASISATDFSPLAGAPLEYCKLDMTEVRDLSFLKNAPLRELSLVGCSLARGFAVLASLKSLERLDLPAEFKTLPEEEQTAVRALRTRPGFDISIQKWTTSGLLISDGTSRSNFWQDWDREWALSRRLRETGFTFAFTALDNGNYRLVLQGQPFSDLSTLNGMPIKELSLDGTQVTDLRPLEGFSLTVLNLEETPVSDLSPLRAPALSASLRSVHLWKCPVTDFSPLAACTNLEYLDVPATGLADLEVVRGRKLRAAILAFTKVADISVLAGMPLERVTLINTPVTDISPLLQCPTLTELTLPSGAQNVGLLRSLPSLKMISFAELTAGAAAQTAAEFWKEYDAKKQAESK